jgi:outer membrane protein TolC
METNYRIKQAKEKIKQADQMVREAQGDFLPQVTLSADGMRRKNNGFDVQDYSQGEYAAVLTYNLFSAGKHLAQYDKNKIVKKEQEEKYKGTMQEEINKIIDAYCSVVYGKLAVEANKRNYDKLVEVYDIVKKKRELGAATMGDESSISASVSNAKTAMTNTESAYNNAKDYYAFLIDKSIDQLTPYEQGFDVAVGDFDHIFEEIKTNNTDLNILRAHIDEKRKDVTINKAIDLPTLDLTLSDTRRYRNDLTSKPIDGANSDLLGQLTLTYNLYSGGKTQAKTARIMSETTDAIYDLEYTTKQTKWDSQKLYNSVLTNTKTLSTLSTEISESKKMTDAYWERFRLASQDLVILLQAQRQVNTAELEKLRSEKTRIIDYFNLLTKQGKLLEYFGY